MQLASKLTRELRWRNLLPRVLVYPHGLPRLGELWTVLRLCSPTHWACPRGRELLERRVFAGGVVLRWVVHMIAVVLWGYSAAMRATARISDEQASDAEATGMVHSHRPTSLAAEQGRMRHALPMAVELALSSTSRRAAERPQRQTSTAARPSSSSASGEAGAASVLDVRAARPSRSRCAAVKGGSRRTRTRSC